jgi:hypothetical protein
MATTMQIFRKAVFEGGEQINYYKLIIINNPDYYYYYYNTKLHIHQIHTAYVLFTYFVLPYFLPSQAEIFFSF